MSEFPPAKAATLAVLAGGEGSRMGGPKALLRVGGQPVLAYLLDRWRWEGPTLLVTAPGRQRPPGAQRFTREVSDPVAGEGPLRGVLTALEAAETQTLVVATCDMPRVEARHLQRLQDELSRRPHSTLLMLKHGEQLQPLPMAINACALQPLREHFAAGGRSLHSLATMPGALVLPAPGEWPDDVWTNFNTPAELAAFLVDQPGVS